MLKIKFTEKQYETLVKLVYLGNWMINSIRETEEDIIKEYEDLEQYIFSFSSHKDSGAEELIKYDPEINQYRPSWDMDMDSDVEKYRLEYEEENFWDELIDRLSVRDVARQYSRESIEMMGWEERHKKRIPFMGKYEKEFVEHGLDRLEIIEVDDQK